MLDPEIKRELRIGCNTNIRWADIVQQLESVQGRRQHEGAREHKWSHQLLEVRDGTGQDKKCKIVNPNVLDMKQIFCKKCIQCHMPVTKDIRKRSENLRRIFTGQATH